MELYSCLAQLRLCALCYTCPTFSDFVDSSSFSLTSGTYRCTTNDNTLVTGPRQVANKYTCYKQTCCCTLNKLQCLFSIWYNTLCGASCHTLGVQANVVVFLPERVVQEVPQVLLGFWCPVSDSDQSISAGSESQTAVLRYTVLMHATCAAMVPCSLAIRLTLCPVALKVS